MAKLYSVYAIFLLLAISGTQMAMVVARDNCQEDIGACGDDCNAKCSSLHQGGQGICTPPDAAHSDKYCWCSYYCHAKICEAVLGAVIIGDCKDDQCTAACRAKYPGLGAQGLCFTSGDPHYSNCHCKYFC